MDPAGAAVLRARLEQQQHWRLAPAVLEGRLPGSDPDVQALRDIRNDERRYEDRDGPFVKRLIDGAWARFDAGTMP